MHSSLAFLIGLLDQLGAADVAWEDLDGPHGAALKTCQQMGVLSTEPGANPVPSCPHCEEGVPYALDGRMLCNRCYSTVDPRHLLLWRLDREAFLRWLSEQLHLCGDVRQVDERLWQLGTTTTEEGPMECFFRRQGSLTESGQTRLSAYRNVLLLFGQTPPTDPASGRGRCLSLLELLSIDGTLTVREPSALLQTRGDVRFDIGSGGLFVGDRLLGEVPVGSKEFFFLRCLASQLDAFVPYADLKRKVLRQSGSRDTTEEATFCHRLKNRIKKRWIAQIDQLLSTTNKGDGYRLRTQAQR